MNVHNQIKYGTDLLRGFSRLVGLGEEEEGAVRLGETITPIVDAWSQPEFALLRGERLYWMDVSTGAVAAERSAVSIRPPSRVLTVVERIRVSAAATIRVSAALLTADSATVGVPRDLRLVRPGAGNDINSRTALARLTEPIANYGVLVWTLVAGEQLNLECVVAPLTELQIVGSADNLALGVELMFRERETFPGEALR